MSNSPAVPPGRHNVRRGAVAPRPIDRGSMGPPRSQSAAGAALAGRWRRQGDEPCVDAYPAELTILDTGVYIAHSPDDVFREWQAGDIELEDRDRIWLQVSNDAMVDYLLERDGDDLITFIDSDHCRITYRRTS